MSDTPVRSRGRLAALGAYGFEAQELVILAALTSGDPMLLIGRSGTGKTFLLNSISEALGLEHRHYNASLISFDDLVGFPYPDDAKTSIRFLETPATVWGAESVLVDEISRCKPEHQNRLFSLVHERKIQGLSLTWCRGHPASTKRTLPTSWRRSWNRSPVISVLRHAARHAVFTEPTHSPIALPKTKAAANTVSLSGGVFDTQGCSSGVTR